MSDNLFSFEQMVTRLRGEQNAKVDAVIVPANNLELTVVGEDVGVFFDTPGVAPLHEQAMTITRYAHGQIAEQTGIPARYYHRMREEAPELLMENVATWWNKSPVPRLVRTIRNVDIRDNQLYLTEPRLRAFLSPSFRILDNLDFAVTVLQEAKHVGAIIQSAHLDESRFYMKLVSPKQELEIKHTDHSRLPAGEPDILQAGIIVRNSEVGDGRIVVQPFAYRLVCRNGLISETQYAQVHLGSKLVEGFLSQETIEADSRAVWLRVRDWVRHGFARENVEEIARAYELATQVEVPEAKIAVANVVKRYELTSGEAQGILEAFYRADDDTQFGLVNAVTRYAHEGGLEYRRQVDLETVGGKLLGENFRSTVLEPRVSNKELDTLFSAVATN